MERDLISVIVPIYNTEKYLKKCIDSIISQTYTNLQIILVNDGSPDNSIEICNEYAKKDARIVIVNKQNGGLSSARNAGLGVATGHYVVFVDSDDYIKEDALDKMMSIMDETQADIAYMSSYIVNEQYEIMYQKLRTKEEIRVFDNTVLLEEMCNRKQGASVCGAIFKREIFDKHLFEENRLNEDYLFNATLCIKEDLTIAATSYCGYYYFVRQNSISRQGLGKSSIDAVYNGIDLIKLAKEENKSNAVKYVGAYAAYQARTAMLLLNIDKWKNNKEFINVCRNVIKENYNYFKEVFPQKKEWLFLSFFMLFPYGAIYIFRFLKRK